ncbi:hypothetical protein TanjilG_10616 [Lupinus angustifolius]|uniref:PAS fold-2 domain-containing protein n=1 Tax=Lupinus angustifolius TaxID=3871 RepID=A0A4P1RV99_LUPAN|nr:hypothetical protein TanjilG_10616 [Lupinus angustifolius]
MITIGQPSFRVIGYSDNSCDMLDITPQLVPSLESPEILSVGTNVRTLFTHSSATLLEKAFGVWEITLLNPIWVHSRSYGKAFYSILHDIDIGVGIDLEPPRIEDPTLSIVGVV